MFLYIFFHAVDTHVVAVVDVRTTMMLLMLLLVPAIIVCDGSGEQVQVIYDASRCRSLQPGRHCPLQGVGLTYTVYNSSLLLGQSDQVRPSLPQTDQVCH